jgi:hypothetical protein
VRPSGPYLFPGQKEGKPLSANSVRKVLHQAIQDGCRSETDSHIKGV